MLAFHELDETVGCLYKSRRVQMTSLGATLGTRLFSPLFGKLIIIRHKLIIDYQEFPDCTKIKFHSLLFSSPSILFSPLFLLLLSSSPMFVLQMLTS